MSTVYFEWLTDELFNAVSDNNVDEVSQLLSENQHFSINVDAVNFEASGLLHVAARMGHTEMVRLLLDRGADVNVRDRGGRAPLHLACMNGHTDTVRLLLDRGAAC